MISVIFSAEILFYFFTNIRVTIKDMQTNINKDYFKILLSEQLLELCHLCSQ